MEVGCLQKENLGGGFLNILVLFPTTILGEMIQFDKYFLTWVGEKPTSRKH